MGAVAVLVALGATLLLVNTAKLHRSADATGRSNDYLEAVGNLRDSSSTPRAARRDDIAIVAVQVTDARRGTPGDRECLAQRSPVQ